MNLYIRMVDGAPFEHPLFEDNFREAFPNVDVNNLPPEFAKFERVPEPRPGIFEVVDGLSYQVVNNVVKDVWHIRAMTDVERTEKIEILKRNAAEIIVFLKQVAQHNIDAADNENLKQQWVKHMEAINAWVFDDPLNPNFPQQPAEYTPVTLT